MNLKKYIDSEFHQRILSHLQAREDFILNCKKQNLIFDSYRREKGLYVISNSKYFLISGIAGFELEIYPGKGELIQNFLRDFPDNKFSKKIIFNIDLFK